ncbi:hypothetical protein [Aliiglaciecola lipolytica]|uniref:hypothetical protein n=1 Tax=Aliiglaciecola lipolytica TaxID=477689 RepID=UPI0002EBF5E6|nr:hypothetical protein [Aliiglaciecola lipolytica]
MSRLFIFFTVFIISLSFKTYAENIESASLRLCEHIKMCVTKQMKVTDDVTPEMRMMIDGMVDNMCQNMMNTNVVKGNREFEKSAIACIDSITELSCDEIQNAGQTPACLSFEKELSSHYPTQNN